MTKIPNSMVRRLIGKWKRHLGLGDWRISWRWAAPDDMATPKYIEALGVTSVRLPEHIAYMEINEEEEWCETHADTNLDLERTILHELVHVWAAENDAFMEMAFETVAPSLTPDQKRALTVGIDTTREGYVRSITEHLLRLDRDSNKKKEVV